MVLATLVVARALVGPQRTLLGSLPPAALMTSCALVMVLLAASSLGLSPLDSTAEARGLLLACSGALLVLLHRPRCADFRLARRSELVACLPGAALLALAAWLWWQPLATAAGSLLFGWDNGAHLLTTTRIHRGGALSYAQDAYPQGVHALVALAVGASEPGEPTSVVLGQLLRTQAAFVLSLYALLVGTVSLTTLRLGTLRGLTTRAATGAATAAGLAVLTPSFFHFTMVFGFVTSIALAVVLATVSLELLQGRPTAITVLVLSAGVMGSAHTWQLALPVTAAPLVIAAVMIRRQLLSSRLLVAGSLALLTGAIPASVAVLLHMGAGAVGLDGELDPLPVGWLAVGVVATAVAAAATCSGFAIRAAAAIPFGMALLAVACAAAADVALDAYYPRKLLWHAALLGLPFAVVLGAGWLSAYHQRVRRLPVLRISARPMAGLALLLLAAFAVPGPYMWSQGGWKPLSGTLAVLMQPADEGAVCRLHSEYDRMVGARLLLFYTAAAQPPPPNEPRLPTCAAPPSAD